MKQKLVHLPHHHHDPGLDLALGLALDMAPGLDPCLDLAPGPAPGLDLDPGVAPGLDLNQGLDVDLCQSLCRR